MKFENANVLITGGASGIGKIMGRMALQKGAKCFIIWDINLAGIEATRKELSRYGSVKGYVVDVSNSEVVNLAYKKTVEDCGNIDILINCAGIITGNKTFDKQTPDEMVRTRIFDWFFGEVMGIYHAMDGFTGRKKGEATAAKAS